MPGLYPTGLSTLHASLGSTFGSLRTGGSYSSEGTEISRLQRPQLTVGRTGAVVGAVLGGRRIWLALAAQLLLSYLAAGASKLAGSTRRKGTAMADIASTHSHGSPAISRMLVRHPFAGRLGSWGTIAFELSMPGVLFLPSVAAPLLLCVAIGFHVVADAAAARLASAGTWRGGVLVT